MLHEVDSLLKIFRTESFSLLCLLAAGSAYGCAKPTPNGPQAFIEWTSENLISVENLDTPFQESEFALFRHAIGNAQVVGLGDSRHDTREQHLLKAFLTRHLIEDLGFRVFIFEESFPHAESLDRYVTSGKGDLRALMNGLAGWYLWDTEEMLELIQWIRHFNEGRRRADQVRIFGMDITAPAPGIHEVLEFVEAAGLDVKLDAQALGLDLQEGDFWPRSWQRYTALSDERRLELTENYDRLIELLREQRSRLTAVSSGTEYERISLLAEIGQMGNALFSSTDRVEGGLIRERGMARITLRILNRETPGERTIIWANNLHVARTGFRMPELAEGTLKPMGILLSEELGEAYLGIGGTFGEGAYPPGVPPGERVFETVSEEIMDGALSKVGVPCFLIDLRGGPENSGAAGWLQREREWRAQDSRALLVPSAGFDLVYFVNSISRSQPTPLALQRYRSLEE